MAIETGQSDFNIIGKKNFYTLPSGPQFLRIRLLFIPFKARKSEAALNSSLNAKIVSFPIFKCHTLLGLNRVLQDGVQSQLSISSAEGPSYCIAVTIWWRKLSRTFESRQTSVDILDSRIFLNWDSVWSCHTTWALSALRAGRICAKCKMVCKCFLILFGQSRVIQYCQKKTGASPTSKPKDHCNASWFHPLSKTRNLPPALFKPCPVFPFKQTSLTEEPHLLNLNLGWSLKYNTDWMMNSFESHQMALHGGVEVWQCCWTECLPSCKLLFSPRALYSLCCVGASYLHFVCAVPGPHYRNDSFR